MARKDELTARQEAFALHVALGESYSEAYRQAGYGCTGNALHVNATNLMKLHKVAVRVNQIRQQRERKLIATLAWDAQKISAMLADTYSAATADRQHGAAATAAMGIAKLHGLLVEKHEDVTRRATRDPAAPKEIDVEHWVTEQRAALAPPAAAIVDDMGLASPVTAASEPLEKEPQPGHADGLPEPQRSDAGLDIVMVHSDIKVGPEPETSPAASPAEEDNPQGSRAPSPEGSGWRKIN